MRAAARLLFAPIAAESPKDGRLMPSQPVQRDTVSALTRFTASAEPDAGVVVGFADDCSIEGWAGLRSSARPARRTRCLPASGSPRSTA
jgi:hypothetical protein